LYTLEVMLYSNGELLDVWQSQVGIRTVLLDQSPDPDERGTRFFRFVLNGVPIFARGADWIPADSFPARVGTERLEMLVRSAADANMNMLRVWGGGFTDERFCNDHTRHPGGRFMLRRHWTSRPSWRMCAPGERKCAPAPPRLLACGAAQRG
jgi:hypothetical protein